MSPVEGRPIALRADRQPSLGREPHRGRSALALDPADLAAGASGAPSRFESHYAPIQGADGRFGPRAELTEPAVGVTIALGDQVELALESLDPHSEVALRLVELLVNPLVKRSEP